MTLPWKVKKKKVKKKQKKKLFFNYKINVVL